MAPSATTNSASNHLFTTDQGAGSGHAKPREIAKTSAPAVDEKELSKKVLKSGFAATILLLLTGRGR